MSPRGVELWLVSAPVRWLLQGLALWLGCAAPAAAEPLTLAHAQTAVTIQSATVHSMRQLPYNWDRIHPGQSGEVVFDFQFELPSAPTKPWGIYLPRLGNAYELWLNGTLLQNNGDMTLYNGADYARVPRFIPVAPGHFQVTNQMRVRIRADIGRRGGLAPPVIGPQAEVYSMYASDFLWRSTGSLVVVVFSLVVGMSTLALWATQPGKPDSGHPGRDRLYLSAAVAQLCWAAFVGDVRLEEPLVAWPWWGMVQVFALAVWGCNMAQVCMDLAGWNALAGARAFRHWLTGLLASCLAMSLWALGFGQPLALTVWYAVFGASLLVFIAVFFWSAVRNNRVEQRLVAMAALVNILVGLRDIYTIRIGGGYGENTWMRYSSVLFGMALGYILLLRFRATSAQLRELLRTLAAKVSQREEALRVSYGKLEQLARQQERTAERSRILRNMHDGVGSHISAAMRQLESSAPGNLAVSRKEVLLTLRDAMDQLKLSIDAIHLVPGDVTALLANLRYRLAPRFAAMGMQLQWDVEPLPDCPGLDAGAMGELQFILFEALSNVLQHANAKVLRIEGHVQTACVVVRVIDDGRGFDPQSERRTGLSSMHARAVAIGAQLLVSSQPGRTVVELRIVAS